MAAELDAKSPPSGPPPDCGPYRYVWIDALPKVREAGRVVNVSPSSPPLSTTRASARSSASTSSPPRTRPVGPSSSAAWWPAASPASNSLFRRPWRDQSGHRHGPVRRHLAALSTHFMANLASRIPKLSWPMIATSVRSIFEQADRDTTWPSSATSSTNSPRPVSATPRYMSWTPPMTSWPSVRSPSSTRPILQNPQESSTKKSGAAPMWSGSSPTAKPSPACSAPCSSSRTTNGSSGNATWAPKLSLPPDHRSVGCRPQAVNRARRWLTPPYTQN